jgi:hypothetical protein
MVLIMLFLVFDTSFSNFNSCHIKKLQLSTLRPLTQKIKDSLVL